MDRACALRFQTMLRGCVWLWLVASVNPYAVWAQIGSWQSHVSYRSGQSIAVTTTKVYAATKNGFFYVDKATGETTTLTKQNGLSDVGISRLLYLSDQNRLLIAYQSGNLDFLSLSAADEPAGVLNVSTIVTASSLPAARTINALNRIGSNVYLSTDFGVVVLDVVKNEIRDTYFSQRADGSALPVYQTAATADSLYALTAPLSPSETGRRLRAVRFSANVNIADPANWRVITGPSSSLESISTDGGRLFATANGQGVYERRSGQWTVTQALSNSIVRLFPAAGGLILATNTGVTVPNLATITGSLLTNPREVVQDGSTIWIADTQSGLLAGRAGTVQAINPEGPSQDQFAGLYAYAQTLVALPSGSQENRVLEINQLPVDLLSIPDSRWATSVSANQGKGFNSAAYLPAEQKLYLGSYGGGLWSRNSDQTVSALTLPTTISPYINALATDANGNLWIATTGTSNQPLTLHVRRSDGQFQSFPIVTYATIAQIVPDDNGFLWLRFGSSGGIQVFDPKTNSSRFLTTASGQGGLLSTAVRTLAKDRDGAIWVGTDLGPTVFDNPYAVFDASIDAQPPLLNRRRLLANEPVTAIAVDGGNRKWIGTRNGLYRVAPDGSQLLDTFTADNSPLPSNAIQALAVEPVSGRLFVETGTTDQSKGLVSYQGSASEPAAGLSNLTIFPNPVRPDFTGTVGINGLTENTTVKIMDAGGQLVYETRSQGGTATWNLRDYRGRSAQTGVYLIVVVTADGAEGIAGKLAVVR